MNTQIRLFFSIFLVSVATAIHADVNPDGSFGHTIPIEIPAGRNGLQPRLALTYNSNSGNGMLGMGWTLSGLPAITRINYGNGINYGKAGFPADTFVGPEGRLIELGNGTGIYHPETETWSKYEASGNCGNGPCSWKVTDRNGLIYQYGFTANSRILAKDANNNDINNGAIRVWALERVTDANGNYYEIGYKKDAGLLFDNGQYYPERISYTLGNGVGKNYAVSFFYDETGRSDKEISYAQSAYVRTTWRLSKIAVDYQSSCFLFFTCSDRVKTYVLVSETAPGSGRSRINQINTVVDSGWIVRNLTFHYNDFSNNFVSDYSPAEPGFDPYRITSGDCNGDGEPDLMLVKDDGAHLCRTSTATNFVTYSSAQIGAGYRSIVGDFDGDGKSDFAAYAASGHSYMLRSGQGTLTPYYQPAPAGYDQDRLMVGDCSGDGKQDLMLVADNGWHLCMIFNGNGFVSYSSAQIGAGYRSVTGDFDGDGRTDFAAYASSGHLYLLRSVPDGFATSYQSAEVGYDADRMMTGDCNGDGKADLMLVADNGNHLCKRGDTTGFFNHAAIQIGAGYRSVTGDFNGDGRTDFAAYASNGHAYFLQSTDAGFGLLYSSANVGYNQDRLMVGDCNGDGKQDLMLFADNGGHLCGNFNTSSFISIQYATIGNGYNTTAGHSIGTAKFFAYASAGHSYSIGLAGKNGDSLTSILDDGGTLTSIEYSSSGLLPVASCPFPCTSPDSSPLTYSNGLPNPAPRYVVTQVTTTSNMDLDGAGGNDTFTTNYDYYNGRMTNGFVHERTNLGFEKIKTTDVNTGNYKIDTYRQDKPFHGRPVKTASYLGNGSKVSETVFPALAQYYCDETGCNTYNALPVTTPTQPQQIRPKLAAQLIGGESSATIATSFENGIAYAAKTEEVLSYDAYGNALSAQQTVSGNGSTRSTYKFVQYINDTVTGRTVGLPYNEKVCLTAAACSVNDGNFVSESNSYFDGQASTGAVGTRKLVTKKESYLSTGAGGVWVPETFAYDALGNVIQKLDAQGITTTIAYDSDYKQYPVTVTKSHGGANSVTEYTYDYRFGKKLTETNHDDNLITIYSIDASGFVTGQQTQNGATILAKKSFAHSPFGTSPIWTQECTFYGATFTTTACRKKFTDALGRVYREEFPELVNGVETQRAIERRYKQNATDRREYVSQPQDPAFDFAADFAALSFPGKWSESVSDNLGRATSARSHDNKTTNVSYQNAGAGTTPPGGSVVCTVNTDVDGVKKRNCTDIGGKPSVVAEAYTGATETIVTYGYDALNRLTSVSSPQGVTSITYVGRSQLQESIIDPVVGTTSYEYYLTPGAADFTKLKKETRPSTTGGTVITDLEYNAPFGRVSKSTKADSVTNYVYDETDLSYGKGRLTTQSHIVDGYTIQDRYSYNDRGETTNTTRRISHATETLCSNVNAMPCLQTFGSTKDELGRMKTMTYPDGKVSVVNYLPGSGKNVSSLTHDGITYATYSDYTFDVAPHVGKVTYGNAVEHAYTYKPENGLLGTTVIGKPAAQAYIDLAYEYDPNLNIQRITDNAIPFLTVSYQYDALNRLTTATWDPDGTEITRVKTYQFDNHGAAMSKGNLTRKDQRRLTYGAGKTYPVSDELWNEGASQWQANATYTWSANGNLLTKGPFTFSYDSNNMMKQAVEVDGSAAVVGDTKFFYDQSGQRFLKKHTRGGVTIKTWYLGDGIEIREKYVGVSAGTPDGTYDSSQSTKYIYGIDNKKLASITGGVYTAALTVTSSSMLALADGHSSSTVSGIANKVYYTFYGAYAHAASATRELTAGQWRIIALASVGLMLLVWLVLTHPLSLRKLIPQPLLLKREGEPKSPLSLKERGIGGEFALWQRATALGMLFAFFTVNCGSQLPPGVTQGQVDTLISDLYTGLPAGTVYYSHNHLGSGALVTDAAGNEVFRITYTEYGEIDLANSGVYNPATTNIEHTVDEAKIFITAVKYTGQEYDPETGFYYYNARYYDPQLGVFTTADSEVPEFSDSQSYNRHMYVRGNPIMYNDPTGHLFWFVVAAVVIGALAGGTKGQNPFSFDYKRNFDWKGAAIGGGTALASALTGGAMSAVTGSFFLGGITGGAAGGALSSGIRSNGDAGEIFKGMFMGMASGFVGGLAGDLTSSLTKDFFGNSLLGSIGHGITVGTVGGFTSGLVSTGIACDGKCSAADFFTNVGAAAGYGGVLGGIYAADAYKSQAKEESSLQDQKTPKPQSSKKPAQTSKAKQVAKQESKPRGFTDEQGIVYARRDSIGRLVNPIWVPPHLRGGDIYVRTKQPEPQNNGGGIRGMEACDANYETNMSMRPANACS